MEKNELFQLRKEVEDEEKIENMFQLRDEVETKEKEEFDQLKVERAEVQKS